MQTHFPNAPLASEELTEWRFPPEVTLRILDPWEQVQAPSAIRLTLRRTLDGCLIGICDESSGGLERWVLLPFSP